LLDVTEVHKRWFNLRDVAVEIFLNTGQVGFLLLRKVIIAR